MFFSLKRAVKRRIKRLTSFWDIAESAAPDCNVLQLWSQAQGEEKECNKNNLKLFLFIQNQWIFFLKKNQCLQPELTTSSKVFEDTHEGEVEAAKQEKAAYGKPAGQNTTS